MFEPRRLVKLVTQFDFGIGLQTLRRFCSLGCSVCGNKSSIIFHKKNALDNLLRPAQARIHET
jgi:hypothetical protein